MSKTLLALLPLAALAQSSIPDTPEFGRMLKQVLSSVQAYPDLPFHGLKYSRQLDLPGAGLCTVNEFAYSCAWEAKPNKYSVAILQNSLASRVGAVIPSSWRRRWEDSGRARTASFTDPAGYVQILVTAPESTSDVVLTSYTVSLVVQRPPVETNLATSEEHFRSGETLFGQGSYQAAANELREALNGDRQPKWVEVWTHIELGKIFDMTGQRARAINEYNQAKRTGDDTNGAQGEAAKYLDMPYKSP